MLLERTSATLDEISKVSGVEKQLARDALIAAIQHNFVVGVEEEREGSKTKAVITQYRIIVQNVLARLRFGKYVHLVTEKYGEEAQPILMHLLKSGRMQIRRLIQVVMGDSLDMYLRTTILDIVKLLRDHKYVMEVPNANQDRCLPCRSLSAEDKGDGEDGDASSTRGRKRSASGAVLPKKTGPEKEVLGASARGKRAAASGSMLTAKSSATSSTGDSADSAATGAKPSKRTAAAAKKTALNAIAPEMRIYEEMDVDTPVIGKAGSSKATGSISAATSASMEIDNILAGTSAPIASATSSAPPTAAMIVNLENDPTEICIDYDRFHREFSKEAIISFVSEKIDGNAGGIMREMMEISETSKLVSEDRLCFNLSNPENAHYNAALAALPKERVRQYLDLMSKDKTGMLLRQTQGFMVSREAVLKAVKQKLIESVVFDRFGRDSLRIFRLLIMKSQLEQKQVAELAMTPVKDTRDCLYKMLASNYVHLQEVPRTNEHNPSKTFYLWNVRMSHVESILVMEMYKALRNMKARLAFTMSTHADLLAKKDEDDRIASERGESAKAFSRLTDADNELIGEIHTTIDRLEVSALHIDDSILTLEEY